VLEFGRTLAKKRCGMQVTLIGFVRGKIKVNAFPASFSFRGPRKETRQAAPNSTMLKVVPAVLRLKITYTRSER
jgi:hypothetical protein